VKSTPIPAIDEASRTVRERDEYPGAENPAPKARRFLTWAPPPHYYVAVMVMRPRSRLNGTIDDQCSMGIHTLAPAVDGCWKSGVAASGDGLLMTVTTSSPQAENTAAPIMAARSPWAKARGVA